MAGSVHVFGIRHHGPGSARTLLRALEELRPDAVLIEGPPDADHLLPLAAAGMEPPVALLVYEAAKPVNAAFYPFASFSPEWQAIKFALEHDTPVAFMDLPSAMMLAPAPESQSQSDSEPTDAIATEEQRPADPIGELAAAAGFDDGERWWEFMVEHRRDASIDVFEAINEAMGALREDAPQDRRNERREAHMRRTIRRTARDAERVAVVCGAWHAPALSNMPPAKRDDETLRGLPKVKIDCTWVPWSYERLTSASGYGAGVWSPGWYEHLWSHSDSITEQWLTRVARCLRDQDVEASSAHVIESARLAQTLAALRGRPLAGLEELSEATEAVLCEGDPTPMALVHDRLIVGRRLGVVPEEAPSVPLQRDLQGLIKRLRLKQSADEHDLDLDLRKPIHLERSHLFHRLSVLGIAWAESLDVRGKAGTFHEMWRLRWEPELAIAVVEASRWGNTVLEAAVARVTDRARTADTLVDLTRLVDDVLLGDLPGATDTLVDAIRSRAATENDVAQLMDALPPLTEVLRYGNVRQSDSALVSQVVGGLATRIVVGLPAQCRSIDGDAAREMAHRIRHVNAALHGAEDAVELPAWHASLKSVAETDHTGPPIAGTASRLLLDAGAIDADRAATMLSLSMSRAAEPGDAALWIEGFLGASGLLLLHDERMWTLIDDWLCGLSDDHFDQIVPILRRAFSEYPAGERRMIGERARSAGGAPSATTPEVALDTARAEKAVEVVAQLLGLGGKP